MRIALLLLAVLGAACSSKGSGAITSIDGKKEIMKLSDAEKKQFCSDVQGFTKKNRDETLAKKGACGAKALIETPEEGEDADVRKACKATFDECMTKPADAAPELKCEELEKLVCEGLTVGELTACMSEQLESAKAMAKEDVCTTAKAGDKTDRLMAYVKKLSGGPKCEVIKTKCDKPREDAAAPAPATP